jgi:hypothetical protein
MKEVIEFAKEINLYDCLDNEGDPKAPAPFLGLVAHKNSALIILDNGVLTIYLDKNYKPDFAVERVQYDDRFEFIELTEIMLTNENGTKYYFMFPAGQYVLEVKRNVVKLFADDVNNRHIRRVK